MNIGLYLSRTALRYPDRLGVVFEDVRLTWSEVDARTNGFAKALKRMGVGKGDRVAIALSNCHQYIEILFASFKLGAIVVPLNAKLHPSEIVFHVNDARAAVLIFSEDAAVQIQALQPQLEFTSRFVTVGHTAGQTSYESLVAELKTNEDQAVDVAADELAWLFYTSGTTGRAKGAMLTHGNLGAMTVGSLADMVPLTPADVTIHCSPLSHGAGLYAIPRVARGAANVIMGRFDPDEFFRLVEAERVTSISSIVPTMIKMLVNSPALEKYDHSSLKYATYGGSPMYVEDLQRAVRRMGSIWVQLFGQGESPMTGTVLPREEHVLEGNPKQLARLESAGYARTDMEVRILGENDEEMPRGALGEVCLRGPTVMKGYWERPDESAKALRGGWLHTGDIGRLDDDGYLYIVDRSKDMVISGGMNLYPREIEEVLQRHPAIYECAVIGVPDAKWGEALKAVIVKRSGTTLSEDDVMAFCAAHLSGYKKPKSVDFVDALPKSAYGKILKRELRAPYWQGTARGI